MGSCWVHFKKTKKETNLDATPKVVKLKQEGAMSPTPSTESFKEERRYQETDTPTKSAAKKSKSARSKEEMDELKKEISNIQQKDDTKKLFRMLHDLDDLVRQTSNDLELETNNKDLKQMDISIQGSNPNQ